MRVRDYCATQVSSIALDASPHEAAEAMHRDSVGCLVVSGPDGKPQGLVTDRDLCLRALAPASGDPHLGTIEALMTSPLETLGLDDTIDAATRRMRTLGVRRMPVVDGGRLVGILALDDLVRLLSGALGELADETRARRKRAARSAAEEEAHEELEELYDAVRERLRHAAWSARETFLADIDAVKAALRRVLGRNDSPPHQPS